LFDKHKNSGETASIFRVGKCYCIESRRSYLLPDGIVCIHLQLDCAYARECTFVT